MKRIFTSILLFFVVLSYSQTNIPQLVSFSAVVRDANNQPLVNTPVSLRLTFREDGQTGPLVYCALHQDETNENGFISIQLNREVLGTGCNGAPSTAFENIPWENGGFWMEVEYQTNPGNPFINLGQLELASNFYSFAAGTAERLVNFDIDIENPNDGDILIYNGATGNWEAGNSNISFSGNYNDLDSLPDFAEVAFSGSYNDLDSTPILSNVATSGDYNDLDNRPIEIDSVSQNNDTLFLSNGSLFSNIDYNSFEHFIGEEFGGGVIFHLWKDALGVEHGLIVDKNILGQTLEWSNITSNLIGASAQNLYDGQGNSNAIISQSGHINSAALMCFNSNNGGFNDWYLPAFFEIAMLRQNIYIVYKTILEIGGDSSLVDLSFFWSSTEASADEAYVFGLFEDTNHNLSTNQSPKNFGGTTGLSVLAIRKF